MDDARAPAELAHFAQALFGATLPASDAALPDLEELPLVDGVRQLIARAGAMTISPPLPEPDNCLARIYRAFHHLLLRDRALLILWAIYHLPAAEIARAVEHAEGTVIGRAAEIAADLYAGAMAAGEGCKILIAEDERITALELREALEEMGHEVPWVVVSAGQAISAASLHRPIFAILDVRLKGGTDGVSAAREIQETLGIPVIVTTAYTDQATRAWTIQPYAYVAKPWSSEDLLRTIQAVLTRIAIERLTPGLVERVSRPFPAAP